MALTLDLHPLASFCHKVLIALYENATPFAPRIVDLGDETDAAELKALWPTGKIPLLHDSGADRVIPETSVMIESVGRRFPGPVALIPDDADAALEVRLWTASTISMSRSRCRRSSSTESARPARTTRSASPKRAKPWASPTG